MSKKGKKSFPFFIQIIAILLVGAILSAGVYFYIQDKNTKRYTVTFANADGTVIETKTVKEGCGVIPSILETDDYVFRGWDAILNNVTQDLETHPIVYKIVEQNLFYFDTLYVREGRRFKLDLMLSGDVNISSGKLILNYDSDVFDYKTYNGNEITKISNSKPGELLIEFNSDEVLKSKTVLAEIEFYAEKKNVKFSEITLTAEGKEMFLLSNDDKQIVDCATINNKIYFIQEVR